MRRLRTRVTTSGPLVKPLSTANCARAGSSAGIWVEMVAVSSNSVKWSTAEPLLWAVRLRPPTMTYFTHERYSSPRLHQHDARLRRGGYLVVRYEVTGEIADEVIPIRIDPDLHETSHEVPEIVSV